jgi:hypothetical protein
MFLEGPLLKRGGNIEIKKNLEHHRLSLSSNRHVYFIQISFVRRP